MEATELFTPLDVDAILAMDVPVHCTQTPGGQSSGSGGDVRAAAAALLGKAWPARGTRHETQMALAGALVRGGWSDEEAIDFLCAVCREAGDEDRPKRARSVKEARARHLAGTPYTGFQRLAELVDAKVVDAARKLLGLSDSVDISMMMGVFDDASVDAEGESLVFVPSNPLKKIGDHEARTYLAESEEWRGVFRFNTLAQRNEIVNPPIVLKAVAGADLSLGDVSKIQLWFAKKGFGVTEKAVIKAFAHIAESQSRKWNPFEEYLNSLPPSNGALATIHETVLNLPGDTLSGILLIKTLVAAVRRALAMPGVGERAKPVDHQAVLVLSGAQGIGKGRLVRILAGQWYHSLDVRRLDDKDTVIKAQGAVLVEMEELSLLLKGMREIVKRFVSASEDCERAAYAKGAMNMQRSYALIATTNEAQLEDPTGHRRFWPIIFPKGTEIRWEALEMLRDSIWREVYDLARTDFSHHLTKEESQVCAERASGIEIETGIEELVADALAGQSVVTMRTVYDHMTKGVKRNELPDRRAMLEIGEILRRLGCERITKRVDGEPKKVWLVPDALRTRPVSPEGAQYRASLKQLEEAHRRSSN